MSDWFQGLPKIAFPLMAATGFSTLGCGDSNSNSNPLTPQAHVTPEDLHRANDKVFEAGMENNTFHPNDLAPIILSPHDIGEDSFTLQKMNLARQEMNKLGMTEDEIDKFNEACAQRPDRNEFINNILKALRNPATTSEVKKGLVLSFFDAHKLQAANPNATPNFH